MMLRHGTSTGPNVMYFETGQGSELSSDAHNGWDQLTMEARCYGFARHYHPFLVNTVVGFIGPEYKQERKILLRNLTGSSAFKAVPQKEVADDAASE